MHHLSLHRASVAPIRIDASGFGENDSLLTNLATTTSSTMLNNKKLRVHRVCLFGFDENKGNTLLASSRINKKPVISSHTDAELAEICLPDGGHLREHDASSIIFKTTSSSLSNENYLYGYFCFRSIRDVREKRGARQASLLIVTDSPGMDLFRPILVDALDVLVTGAKWGDADHWTKCLNTLKSAMEHGFNAGQPRSLSNRRLIPNPGISFQDNKDVTVTIEMWNRAYQLRPPQLCIGELGGASLKDVLRVFREKTMRLWYALAAERRIVIVGSSGSASASSVSNLVLAMPLLLGELAQFVVPTLEPYLTLAVVDRITKRRTFICGSNNSIFQHKPEWWDLCADMTSGTITEEFHHFSTGAATSAGEDETRTPSQTSSLTKLKSMRKKLSHKPHSPPSSSHHHHPPRGTGGTEMAFVSRVLHDMDFQSEAWLRRQFHDFTLSFLNRVGRRELNHQVDLTLALAGLFPGRSIMQPRLAKFAEQFPSTCLWKKYRAKQDETWGGVASPTTGATEPTSTVVVPSPSSSSMSTGADGFSVEDPAGFLLEQKQPTLAPFHLETATGTARPPTGFIGVRDVQPKTRLQGEMDKAAALCERWVKVVQKDGDEPYYWNVKSGETKWEIPDDDLL